MNRMRIGELNGKTRFCGGQINTHEHRHTSEHNILNYDSRFHSSRRGHFGMYGCEPAVGCWAQGVDFEEVY